MILRAWHWGVAAFLCAAGLIYGSLLPFDFHSLSFTEAWRSFQSLRAEGPASSSSQDFAVNVLIAIPLSFSLMGALLLRRDGTLALFAGTCLTLVICFLVSCTVEFAQFWIFARVSSFRDIAAQVCGASVGVLIWVSAGEAISRQLEHFVQNREPASRVVWLLNAYVIGVVIWSLLPFDFITDIGEIGRKYRDGRIEIVPFTYPFPTALKFWFAIGGQAALLIPVGVWSVIAWVPRKSAIRSSWTALAFCLSANVAVELAQLLVKSRYTSSTDMLTGTLGCAVGIWAVHLWKSQRDHAEGRSRSSAIRETGFWLLTSFAYSLALLGVAWAPFEFTRDQSLIRQRLRTFTDIPFRMIQASGSDVGGMFHIIRNFMWYVPLGVLVAVAAGRASSSRRLRWVMVLLAAVAVSAVAVTSVAGQLLLPGNKADLTVGIIRAMGGFAGLTLATVIVSRWHPRS